MSMETVQLELKLHTPAFLGDASQEASWRTPPLKAALRQWWRVAYAASHNFEVDPRFMLQDEGLLFGTAGLDERGQGHQQSKVRMRLDTWQQAKAGGWERLQTVRHPEAGRAVPADVYLAYGPIAPNRPERRSLGAGQSAKLRLAFPSDHAQRLGEALWLMHRFGTLGSRSRNGWGSFSLSGPEGCLQPFRATRNWQEALRLDWPHALGSGADGRPLIWTTQELPDWRACMVELARIKIGIRTQHPFPQTRPNGEVEDRHWLAYPVTRHSVSNWDRDKLRLPNSLRFKVVPAPADPSRLQGLVFHVPCLPPSGFSPQRQRIEAVWTKVHAWLDEYPSLTRMEELQ